MKFKSLELFLVNKIIFILIVLLFLISTSCGSGIMSFDDLNLTASKSEDFSQTNILYAPSFSLPSGLYNEKISIELEANPSDAEIYYTTDGSIPDSSKTKYEDVIELAGSGSSLSIQAIAIKDGYENSVVSEASYSIKLKMELPTLDIKAGVYSKAFSVNISSTVSGAVIKYTSDGSDPSTSTSAIAASTVRINKLTTLKVYCSHSDWDDSDVLEAKYLFPTKTVTTTIQAAIDAASTGDIIHIPSGTVYTENININKRIILIGDGSDSDEVINTVIRKSSDAGIVQVSASGASISNPIMIKDLRIESDMQNAGGTGEMYGAIEVSGGASVSYLELNSVKVIGISVDTDINNSIYRNLKEIGLYVGKDSSLSYLTIKNSVFDDLAYGFYFHKRVIDVGSSDPLDTSNVNNVSIKNSAFINNDVKAMYLEKLSNAVMSGVLVYNNGKILAWMPSYIVAWNGGIDVNVKTGSYENLTFSDITFYKNGLGSKEGTALAIKARGSGSDSGSAGRYAANPASLKNISITECSFYGNERAIRLGEPGNELAEPLNVKLSYSNIYNNTMTYGGGDGSDYGGFINLTTTAVDAQNNWWGNSSGPAHSLNAGGTGETVVDVTTNAAMGAIDYSSWLSAEY